MKVETVKSVLVMDAGSTCAAFKGRVKKVFDQTAGTTDGGRDWKKQNFIAHDGTFEISVTLWGQSQLKAAQWEGQVIYIVAEEGGKQLKVGDYTNKKSGKTVRQLQADESATVTPHDEAAAQEQEREEGEAGLAPKPAPRSSPSNVNGVAEARLMLGRAANLMLLCLDAASYVSKAFDKKSGGGFIAPEQFQAITSTMFIAADRRGLLDAMPTGPIAKKENSATPLATPQSEGIPADTDPDGDVPF